MGVQFSNKGTSLLASSIDTDDTALSVTSGTGGRFPTLTTGNWCPIVLTDASGNFEITRATARVGDVITVVRGQEGTIATSFSAGARVDMRLTAAVFAELRKASGLTNDSDVLGETIREALDQLLADKLDKLDAAYLAALPETGDCRLTYKTAAPPGWIMMNDGTIGNSTSNASTRANEDAWPLFSVFWGMPETWVPIFTSGGIIVTRGASAAADFAASRQIACPKVLGRALAIAGQGANLTARALAEFLGAEGMEILKAHLPNYDLTVTNPGRIALKVDVLIQSGQLEDFAAGGAGNFGQKPSTQTYGSSQGTLDLNIITAPTINSGGQGQLLPIMQPSTFINVKAKL